MTKDIRPPPLNSDIRSLLDPEQGEANQTDGNAAVAPPGDTAAEPSAPKQPRQEAPSAHRSGATAINTRTTDGADEGDDDQDDDRPWAAGAEPRQSPGPRRKPLRAVPDLPSEAGESLESGSQPDEGSSAAGAEPAADPAENGAPEHSAEESAAGDAPYDENEDEDALYDEDEDEDEDTEDYLTGLLEALLFVSPRPLSATELARAAGLDRPRTEELLARLQERRRGRGVVVDMAGEGYVMRSAPRYAKQVQTHLSLKPTRISRIQLETLAIVAYRQPTTKPEIDDIRGVDSGQVLKGLLDRGLVRMLGKKDEPGRPMLYGTTPEFLELLSLRSLRDLPTLREYTELTEESREKFRALSGDEADETPPGAGSEAASAADEGSRLQVAPDGDSKRDGDDKSDQGQNAPPAEAPGGDPEDPSR